LPSRNWKSWPKRALKEIDASNSFVGLAGIGLGIVTSPFISVIAIAGFVGYVATKSFPKRKNNPSDLIGAQHKVEEIRNVDPPLKSLGIVGASRTGKSTLINHIRGSVTDERKTDNIYAVVVPLQVQPVKYIALLDGAGHQFSQQFTIAEHSDFLVIFLDNDLSDATRNVNEGRLEEHDKFLDQLYYYLRGENISNLQQIHFILNKKDLWDGSADASKIEEWFKKHIDSWSKNGLAKKVTWAYHSNKSPDDITKFLVEISKSL
jgi:hypothetical protein